MTSLNIEHVTKQYGPGQPAVRDLSLSIASGEIIGVLGPSGCGKTTTLKMIAGLLHPSHGDIRFDGISFLDIPAEKRGAVMVFQNHLLFPYMSIIDNVSFGLRMRKVPKAAMMERAMRMLEMVRLKGHERKKPSELSGGQQQRVALARALVTEPRLLLLDEPLSNLDAHLRYEMRELILRLQRELKITTIFVTHDQHEAVLLADRIALMFDGVLHQFTTPREFYEKPLSEKVARFFGAENFIKGVKAGAEVKTPLGVLQVNGSAARDGEVLVSIRPECCDIGDLQGENMIRATVRGIVYEGTKTLIRAERGGVELQVAGSPSIQHAVGDVVGISLPPEYLVIIPSREN